ncbi:MAG: hypothetical protein ACUVV6_08290 [Thermoplasmatota archaeon]
MPPPHMVKKAKRLRTGDAQLAPGGPARPALSGGPRVPGAPTLQGPEPAPRPEPRGAEEEGAGSGGGSGGEEEVEVVGAAGEEGAGMDEVLRLKKEFSEKLFELELERSRIDDIGIELAERSEELERQRAALTEELERTRRELEERGAAIERQETDLEKKAGLLSAGQEALAALSEELREKERKVREVEEETRRLQKEVEDARKDLHRREEDIRKAREELHNERTALEDARGEAERLARELGRRERELKEGEAEAEKAREQLAQARKEAEEAGARLKGWEERLRRKEEELRALEAHLLSIEEDLKLCPHCGSVDEFEHLTRRCEELRRRGEDVDDLSAEVKAARRALREGDYSASEEHARRAAESLRAKEAERERRDVASRIVAAESLVRMLREARADVSQLETILSRAWEEHGRDRMAPAAELAEKARLAAQELERERFQALDELAACGSVIQALKKSGVNTLAAEQKRAEAEGAMSAGDFKRARALASETMLLVSEAAQTQDSAAAMSQIRLAEETIEEVRGLGLDASEWERTLHRSREFLKKLDFKSAEETARWVRSRARDASRVYKQAVVALDHASSVISTYSDVGLVVKRAEELAEEARAKLKRGEAEPALNLARKAERMAREISERHRGALLAIKKTSAMIRSEKRRGRDVSRGEKLHELAINQLEAGEYANAMKLANKVVESLSTSGSGVMELCPTCGEAIPEGIKECPECARKARERAAESAPEKRKGIASKAQPGSKGGRKYACPYCGELFEIMVTERPITVACPWCENEVSVME